MDAELTDFRQMVDAARRFSETGEVIGLGADRVPPASLRSFEGVIAKTTDWRTLGTPQKENAPVG